MLKTIAFDGGTGKPDVEAAVEPEVVVASVEAGVLLELVVVELEVGFKIELPDDVGSAVVVEVDVELALNGEADTVLVPVATVCAAFVAA